MSILITSVTAPILAAIVAALFVASMTGMFRTRAMGTRN